ERRHGGVLRVLPLVDVALGGLEGLPGYREERAGDLRDAVTLLLRGCLVEGQDGPQHLALRKVAAQIAGEPELPAVERRRAVVTLVDLVGDVGAAEVLAAPAAVVTGRLRVEVALAEHRTAARFDGGRVHRPVG